MALDDFFTPGTPGAQGYRWPAEWEPHASTWLSWPHNRDTWPNKFEPVPGAFARFVKTLAQFEPVNILAGGEETMATAQALVGHLANVALWDIPTNDAWCRDHGPAFLCGKKVGLEPLILDWGYNAWGGKYPPFDLDDVAPTRVAEKLNRKCLAPGMILEGGAIEGNGAGAMLTTEACLLNPNRNPGMSKQKIEQYLRDYYGVRRILWCKQGSLSGDDTDSHIDQLARFVGPSTVVVAACSDKLDPNYKPLWELWDELTQFRTLDGQRILAVPLYLPMPKFEQGQRLPCSYCNFVFANDAVLVPTFDDPADVHAIETFEELFPDRKVVGVPSLDLIWGLGSLHCLSQQEPLCGV
jgi:agmatine deiminase